MQSKVWSILLSVFGVFLLSVGLFVTPVQGEEPVQGVVPSEPAKADAGGKKAEPKSEVKPALRAAVPERSNPRATMDTFLTAMSAHSAGNGGEDGMQKAVACLDLAGAGIPIDQGPEYADKIKSILDKLWYVMPDELPESPDAPEFRRLLQRDGKTYGQVVLARLPNAEWKFEASFLKKVPQIYDAVQQLGHVSVGLWLEDQMPSSLRKVSFLLENWQWLGLLILILAGVVLDRVIGWFVSHMLSRWLRRLKVPQAEQEAARLERPAGLAVMAILWWVGLHWLNLPLNILAFLGKVALFFLAAAGVWALYRAVDVLAAWLGQLASRTETKMDDLLIPLIRKTLKIFVVVFGMVFVADNLGINVTTLLAGLGIGGIAFALAAKDTVENFFGSITVLLDRPFQIGDWVVIGDVEGLIEEVGFRSTRIRTFYNSLVTVPNSKLVNANVDNYGLRFKRRIKMMLGVTYSTPAEKIEAFGEGIRELILLHPYTAKDFYIVRFNEFANSSLNLLLYCFLITPDWATELRERERLLLDIKRLAERLGIEFAFPTQTLHIETLAAPAPLPARPQPALPEARSVSDARALGRNEARSLVKELVGLGEVPDPVAYPNPEQYLAEVKQKAEVKPEG